MAEGRVRIHKTLIPAGRDMDAIGKELEANTVILDACMIKSSGQQNVVGYLRGLPKPGVSKI